jgi:C1A family cysteine protease
MYRKSRLGRRYNWHPDRPDHRDLLYRDTPPVVTLPQAVDLRPMCSPVVDQGRLGSCTANALAGHLEFLEKKYGHDARSVSRLFIYYNERALEGHIYEDSGASIRDGIKTLCPGKLGYCPESLWPYDISRFTFRPPKSVYAAAKLNVIKSYERLLNIFDMQACLAESFPFVMGITVFEGFESPEVAKSGVVSMPGDDEQCLGGHAVMVVGYDDPEKRFIVRNSWGSGWGIAGYFFLPFEYVQKLGSDFWGLR